MTTDKNSSPVTVPMWWDGGDRAITAREKATIEEHGPSCFSIALVPATPSARWAADGLPDPHAGRYACERAALTLGNLTDDELANAVYLHGNEQPSMADLLAGKALSGIVYLTAAKDRIRWLSRALEATCKQPLQVGEVQGDAARYRSVFLDAVGMLTQISLRLGVEPNADGVKPLLAAIDALAARQPRAQERVAWASTGATGHKVVAMPGLHKLPYGDYDLYAAPRNPEPVYQCPDCRNYEHRFYTPPAQGIDLAQQQDAARWRWVREQSGVTVSVEEVDDDGDMAFVSGHTPEELDAAIDGQRDAAPGVGNG